MLLAFDDYGPGPVVVLLHGFPLDRSMWSAAGSEVSSVYRVIAPDLRGFGETAAPDGVYQIDDMADDVIELLDAMQIREPVVLGGLSMGGYVWLSAAVRYPDRFRALVLVDTKATADTPEAARNRESLATQVTESGSTEVVVQGMLPKLFSPFTRVNRPQVIEEIHEVMKRTTARAVIGALRGMAARPDRTRDLLQLTMPALVVVGVDDVITPVADAKAMADALPDARLEVIKDAGHMSPVENPSAFNEALLSFLAGLK